MNSDINPFESLWFWIGIVVLFILVRYFNKNIKNYD
jgi:hypothetical protein